MTRRRDHDAASAGELVSPVVERFSEDRVRAARASARIAQAVSEAIRQSGRSREAIAEKMSDYLGERVTAEMLYQYSSTANERNNIPAHRLIALCAIIGDIRVLNAALQDTDFVAVDSRFEPLIRREIAKEKLELLQYEINAADEQWRASK